jgi:hypothetical protein
VGIGRCVRHVERVRPEGLEHLVRPAPEQIVSAPGMPSAPAQSTSSSGATSQVPVFSGEVPVRRRS